MNLRKNILYLTLIIGTLNLAPCCRTNRSGSTTSSPPEPQEMVVSGNVLVLEDPVRATGTALTDARRFLQAKRTSDASTTLARALELNDRVQHYHLVLLGVRSYLAHARYVIRVANNEASTLQLEKASRLIAEHLDQNKPRARDLLRDLKQQIDTLTREIDHDPSEARRTLKRLTSLADDLARKYP